MIDTPKRTQGVYKWYLNCALHDVREAKKTSLGLWAKNYGDCIANDSHHHRRGRRIPSTRCQRMEMVVVRIHLLVSTELGLTGEGKGAVVAVTCITREDSERKRWTKLEFAPVSRSIQSPLLSLSLRPIISHLLLAQYLPNPHNHD